MPEILRVAGERPVTVVEGQGQIACIVSVTSFVQIGDDPEQLEVESWA